MEQAREQKVRGIEYRDTDKPRPEEQPDTKHYMEEGAFCFCETRRAPARSDEQKSCVGYCKPRYRRTDKIDTTNEPFECTDDRRLGQRILEGKRFAGSLSSEW